jgi:hypothetical protein
MKLHDTAITTLIRIFTTYGGHRSEHRLKDELGKLQLETYDQQTTGKTVLVTRRDIEAQKRANQK